MACAGQREQRRRVNRRRVHRRSPLAEIRVTRTLRRARGLQMGVLPERIRNDCDSGAYRATCRDRT